MYLFGTLNLEFADPEAALALPDQAWYPFITLTGFSGGVFDMIEHNLGAEVTINVCFTETQGILVFHHNTTTSVVDFEELPENCDFVNAVPLSPGKLRVLDADRTNRGCFQELNLYRNLQPSHRHSRLPSRTSFFSRLYYYRSFVRQFWIRSPEQHKHLR